MSIAHFNSQIFLDDDYALNYHENTLAKSSVRIGTLLYYKGDKQHAYACFFVFQLVIMASWIRLTSVRPFLCSGSSNLVQFATSEIGTS